MKTEDIMELFGARIKAEAIKVQQSRLENISNKLRSVVEKLGLEDIPENIQAMLHEVDNRIVVIENGGGVPEEMDVLVVIDKIIGWIYVNPERVVRLEN